MGNQRALAEPLPGSHDKEAMLPVWLHLRHCFACGGFLSWGEQLHFGFQRSPVVRQPN